MRHRVAGRQLNRTSEHRVALRRNLAQSLIEHETISTTIEKAKEVKPFVEKLITLARRGKLQHRRRAIALLGNREILDYEDRQPVTKGTVVGKLFSELGPRYLDRPGGYTRIIRLSLRRLGDNGELVLLQLLGEDEPLKKEKPAAKKRARRRSKAAAGTKEPAEVEKEPQEASETAEDEEKSQQTPTAEDAGEQEESELDTENKE
jgi:large subunit ribosomal protein L17